VSKTKTRNSSTAEAEDKMEKKINESSELHSAGKYKESMKASLIVSIQQEPCGNFRS
jgi:hypothetical protein